MVTSSSTGQAIASASLSSELSVGTILWIKELVESDSSERYGLPPVCFKHPCVVVDLSASRKGFVQVYVITSKGGQNINDLPLPPRLRSQYVPISPKPFNTALPGVQLHLAGDIKLRKDSYVNTANLYTLPFSKLELYDRKRPITDYRLDSASVRWLRWKAFGEPLEAPRINRAVTPSSPSELRTPHDPSLRPLLPYAAVPSAQSQPAITIRSTMSRRNRRRLHATEVIVLGFVILVTFAIAALAVYGVAFWASSGFYL